MPEVGDIYICAHHRARYLILSIDELYYEVRFNVQWLDKVPPEITSCFGLHSMRKDRKTGKASDLLMTLF